MVTKKDLIVYVLVVLCIGMIVLAFVVPAFKPASFHDLQREVDTLNDSIGELDSQMAQLRDSMNGLQARNNILEAEVNALRQPGFLDEPAYDSGWLNITASAGQFVPLVHNLNGTDILVDIAGKTAPDSQTQTRNLGLTGCTEGWSRMVGGIGDECAYSVIQTSDGGLAIAGETNSAGAGNYDFWLIKTDAFGTVQWSTTYGGTGSEQARAIVQADDKGYVIGGWTNSSGAGGYDFWLVKTDSGGNIRWNSTFGGSGNDYAYSLARTRDGGYAVAGFTESFGAGSFDMFLVKTDSNGALEWNRTFGGAGYDGAYSLIQTPYDEFVLAGLTFSYGAGSDDFYLVKTDADGEMQWNRTYGGLNAEFAYSLIQTTDNGYAMAGSASSFGAGSYDFWLVKTDSFGNVQWSRVCGGRNHDVCRSVIQTIDGGYALAGATSSCGAGMDDFWLVRTDGGGNVQWNKTYGGSGGEGATSLLQTTKGDYVLAGFMKSYGANNGDVYLIKAPSESGLAWVDSSTNAITLYRGQTDAYWNYVRVRIWKIRT